MSATVTLTIPNKATHIAHRDELQKNHSLYETSIDELTNTRRDLLTRQQQSAIADITLVNAVTTLENYRRDVGEFNQTCETTQTNIDTNNKALRDLLARIQSEIEQVKARKAAADAAAAVAADQAATLQNAKNALQEYITTLQSQHSSINENNIDDIAGQIQSSADTITTIGTDYSNSLSSDEAISQGTKRVITAFKADTVKDSRSTILSLNELTREFRQAKNTVVDGLRARIEALEAVADEVNVTADQITAALDGDKKNPTPDNSLGEIKTRAAEIAHDIGAKATIEFPTRKREIDRFIEADKASFEEKQKITEEFKKIKDIFDSEEFKKREAAIQQNIENAQIAERAALDDNLSSIVDKLNKNLRFGRVITGLNASIFSLETYLQHNNLEQRLNALQESAEKIQQPPIDIVPIQARLKIIQEATRNYKDFHEIHLARAQVLSAENAAAKSKSQSPVSPRGSPSTPRTDATQREGRSESSSDSENEGADTHSSLLAQRKQNPQRRRPTSPAEPASKRTRYLYIPPTNDKDDIYIIDLEKGPNSDSGGGGPAAIPVASNSTQEGGKIIQRGGNPPTTLPDGAVMYRLGQTPEEEKILLLASLRSAKDVLNDEELIQKLKNRATTVSSDTAIAKYNAIQTRLISNKDTGILTIARWAVYKSSILDLMGILDAKLNRYSTLPNQQIPQLPGVAQSDEVPSVATRSKVKLPQTTPPQEAQQLTYTDMYERLWKFMNSNDSAGIIKLLKPTNALESEFANIDFSQIVGWEWRSVTNPNLDSYFNAFTTCRSSKSTFLTEITKRVNKHGQDVTDKNVAYRFKLNWIILIAFYCLQTDEQVTYKNVGEFIENTYDTFLDWMKKEKNTYEGMFFKNRHPVLEEETEKYSKRVTKKLAANINSDPTFILLQHKITKKLCEGQMTTDAANHENDPKPPSEDVPTVGPIVPPLSSYEDTTSNTAGATTMSPSPRQAWMTANLTSPRPVRVPVGPKTPPSPFARRPLASNEQVFNRIPVPPNTVPSLNLQSIPRVPVEIQSAKPSRQLLRELHPNRRISRIAGLGNQSARPSIVDRHNPARKPGAKGALLLPGQLGNSATSRNNQVSEGTGDFDWLSNQPDKSQYVLLNSLNSSKPLQPAPPTSARTEQLLSFTRRLRNPKNNTNTGGHKRTRKHHRSVPSSVPAPAPATRRHHRDDSTANASSSQKRTRRQRRASIRT